MKTSAIIIIFSLFIHSLNAQNDYELKGKLTDCSDSLPLILGHLILKQRDSIIQVVSSDDKGQFIFEHIGQGTFQLETHYYYYPSKKMKIIIPNDNEIEICIFEGNSDSLLSAFKTMQTYTIYYYGLPEYSDEELNDVGRQYGVKWQNLGCVVRNSFDKYNKMIEKILNYRNGKDWQTKFWTEVEKKYD